MVEDDRNKLPFCESKMFDDEAFTTVVPEEEPIEFIIDTSDEIKSNQAALSSLTEVSACEET